MEKALVCVQSRPKLFFANQRWGMAFLSNTGMRLFYSSLASTLQYLVNMSSEKQKHSIRGTGIVSTYIQLPPIAHQNYLRLTGLNASQLANIHAQFVFKDRHNHSQILQTNSGIELISCYLKSSSR